MLFRCASHHLHVVLYGEFAKDDVKHVAPDLEVSKLFDGRLLRRQHQDNVFIAIFLDVELHVRVRPGVIWNLYSVREEINVRGLSVEAETLDVESAFVQEENVTSHIVLRILELAQVLGRLLGRFLGRRWGCWGHSSLHGRLGSCHWSRSSMRVRVCHVMGGVGWSRGGVRVGSMVVGGRGMGV